MDAKIRGAELRTLNRVAKLQVILKKNSHVGINNLADGYYYPSGSRTGRRQYIPKDLAEVAKKLAPRYQKEMYRAG